jgi:sec-independent protein translocase protein TatC
MGLRFRSESSSMPLRDHLKELRTRLLRLVAVMCVGIVIGFILYPHLLNFLQSPYCKVSPRQCHFLVTNPLDGLSIRVKVSIYFALLMALPFIFWHTWRFITPGLKRHERTYALSFVTASVTFFALGAVTAYFSFSAAITWLQNIGGQQLTTYYSPNEYINLFILMLVAFGVTFEFPVALVALQLAELVTPRGLLRQWRYAVIAITVASALITPSGDPLSMFALGLPLVFFYFLAIGVGRLLGKK